MNNIPYTPFNTFVFRTPYFALVKANGELDMAAFEEAILLASPSLYSEYRRIETLGDIEKNKVKLSIYKYLSRSYSRCTPFGLILVLMTAIYQYDIQIVGINIESFRFTHA